MWCCWNEMQNWMVIIFHEAVEIRQKNVEKSVEVYALGTLNWNINIRKRHVFFNPNNMGGGQDRPCDAKFIKDMCLHNNNTALVKKTLLSHQKIT